MKTLKELTKEQKILFGFVVLTYVIYLILLFEVLFLRGYLFKIALLPFLSVVLAGLAQAPWFILVGLLISLALILLICYAGLLLFLVPGYLFNNKIETAAKHSVVMVVLIVVMILININSKAFDTKVSEQKNREKIQQEYKLKETNKWAARECVLMEDGLCFTPVNMYIDYEKPEIEEVVKNGKQACSEVGMRLPTVDEYMALGSRMLQNDKNIQNATDDEFVRIVSSPTSKYLFRGTYYATSSMNNSGEYILHHVTDAKPQPRLGRRIKLKGYLYYDYKIASQNKVPVKTGTVIKDKYPYDTQIKVRCVK